MNLDAIRDERKKWMGWKNTAPIFKSISELKDINNSLEISDTISLKADIEQNLSEKIKEIALALRPWRKGPFDIFGLFIDSEWKSNIKYNLLEPYFNLENKIVADVGCNNGYYMFRMLEQKPKKIVGFDPSATYKLQFDFINHFAKTDIEYELLGVEHLEFYEHKFDTIFCLGVLYHRTDPISMLKSLKKSINRDGEVILDTFMIDGDKSIALCPEKSYSKIPNVHFVPTVTALKNWSHKTGFSKFEVLTYSTTSSEEQRKTDWIEGQSLEDFLDPEDSTKTVEGYPAPKRVYVRLKI